MDPNVVAIIVAAIALVGTLGTAISQHRTAKATHNVQEAATAINGLQALVIAYREEIERLTEQISTLRQQMIRSEAQRAEERERFEARIAQLEDERAEIIAKYDTLRAKLEERSE